MKNQVFVPTVAKFSDDIRRSWCIQEPLVQAGYQPGLMLVILKGLQGVTADAEVQIENLKGMKEEYGDRPVVVMLSNIPLDQMDWLHNTEFAAGHVKAGVDFAKALPIGKRRIVTFHLNSLVKEKDFLAQSAAQWRELFKSRIAPWLKNAAQYAASHNVELEVETVPVPEYGDWLESKDFSYLGHHVRHLRNPFYLTSSWGFQELRQLGYGICLDLCHTHTIYKTARQANSYGIIFDEDKKVLAAKGLGDDVATLQLSDLVHLNDGRGLFTRDGSVFEEGVALGQGDIDNLAAIIGQLNERGIPFVIEVDEHGDFKNRPGTQASIEYLVKLD